MSKGGDAARQIRKRQRSLRAAALGPGRMRRALSTGHSELTDEALGLAPLPGRDAGDGLQAEPPLDELRASLALGAADGGGAADGWLLRGSGELALGPVSEDSAGAGPGAYSAWAQQVVLCAGSRPGAACCAACVRPQA